MTSNFDFDLFVIGGGSGGVRAARIAGRYGARVGMAEEIRVGGTCVLRGCVPKKLFVTAARFHDDFADSVGYGWDPGTPSFDWPTLVANKDRELDRLNAAYVRGLDGAGVRIFNTRAVIAGPNRVALGDGQTFTARSILIATGGYPNREAGIAGAELAVTSDEMFDLKRLPQKILIVGAGYVAVEFAAIMNGLGVQTTVLHRGTEILRSFDHDLRQSMRATMERRGITMVPSDRLVRIERSSSGLTAQTEQGRSIDADEVLLAIGRTPNTRGIGLETVGVELDAYGAIKVDPHSRTTAADVYAVGDVTNRVNLTPVAIREGHILADHLFGGRDGVVDHDDIPHAVFGIPEIGTVGLTEEAARRDYPGLDIYQAVFKPMLNQLAGRDERTLIKLVVDAETDRLLGSHIFGDGAAELTQLMAVAIKLKATKQALDSTMALHPTVAEEIVTMREPARRYRGGQAA